MSQRSRGRAALWILALVVGSSAVGLLAVEVGYRWYLHRRFLHMAGEWSHPLYVMRTDLVAEYELRPNCSMTQTTAAPGEVQWSFTTNSLGMRGPEIAPGKGPQERRVLFLGDSYAFGWGVGDDETFPSVLQKDLSGAFAERGEVIVCINAGIPGYNTVQELDEVVRHSPRLQPDLVVLCYVMNDAEPQLTVVANPAVTRAHASSWFLDDLKRWLNIRVGWGFLPVAYQTHDLDYVKGFRPGHRKAEGSRMALEGIHDHVRGLSAELVVAILPDFTQPFDGSYRLAPIHEAVREWCRAMDVPVVDVLDALRGEDSGALQVPGDGHPNAEAHRRMARALHPAIVERLAGDRAGA